MSHKVKLNVTGMCKMENMNPMAKLELFSKQLAIAMAIPQIDIHDECFFAISSADGYHLDFGLDKQTDEMLVVSYITDNETPPDKKSMARLLKLNSLVRTRCEAMFGLDEENNITLNSCFNINEKSSESFLKLVKEIVSSTKYWKENVNNFVEQELGGTSGLTPQVPASSAAHMIKV